MPEMFKEFSGDIVEREAFSRTIKDFKSDLYKASVEFALEDRRLGGKAVISTVVLDNFKRRLEEIIKYSGISRDELKADLEKWKKQFERGAAAAIDIFMQHIFIPTGME